MAEAVSWLTGKAAICIGMLGPGVANLAGAMMCARVEKLPGHLPGRATGPDHRAAGAPRPHPVRRAVRRAVAW